MFENIFNNKTSQFTFCHAQHSTAENGTDIISIKYKEQLPDGTIIPRFNIIENFQRPYWVVRPEYRKYKDKKTYEPFDRLKKCTSTQTRLRNSIARELGYRTPQSVDIRDLLASPYVYGLAPSVTSLIKHKISEAWPDALIKNEFAASDIETDMVNGNGIDPIMQGITFKGRVNLAITNKFLKNIDNPKQKILDAIDEYIRPVEFYTPGKKPIHIKLADWCKTVNIDFVETGGAVGKTSLMRLHEFRPDIVGFWNQGFDIPKIIDAIKADGDDPSYYFNDPCVPPKARHFKWNKDEGSQKAASGKTKFKPDSERWHYLETHAGFVFIDPMSYYRKNRAHLSQEISYKLDHIGKKLVGMGKLRFNKADHLAESSAQWHEFMQKYYPVEYAVYCIVDCILVELIDLVTKDMSDTIGPSTDKTEYQKMFSLPNLLEHSYFFEMLGEGVVLGQAGRDMKHELDKFVIGSNNIIISLPSFLIKEDGVRLFKDAPGIISNLFIGAFDNDIRSAYPYGELMFNLERETLERELVGITGKDVRGIKAIGFAACSGMINSAQVCRLAYNYPSLMDLQIYYEKTH